MRKLILKEGVVFIKLTNWQLFLSSYSQALCPFPPSVFTGFVSIPTLSLGPFGALQAFKQGGKPDGVDPSLEEGEKEGGGGRDGHGGARSSLPSSSWLSPLSSLV